MCDNEDRECSASVSCSSNWFGSPCPIASVGAYNLGSLPQLRSASSATAKRASRSQEYYYKNYVRRCPRCGRIPDCKDDYETYNIVECDSCRIASEEAPTVRGSIDNWNRGKVWGAAE